MLSPRISVRGLSGTVNTAFGFAYALARRRGIPEEIKTTGSPTSAVGQSGLPDIDDNDEVTTRVEIKWRPEFIATYRHLREHGNSAFIFLFELALAALVSCLVAKPRQSPAQQIGAIGALFALWSIPAVFVHLLGQHLERRFSRFDERLNAAQARTSVGSKHG